MRPQWRAVRLGRVAASGVPRGAFRLKNLSRIGARPIAQGERMHKALIGLAAAASLGLATAAVPTSANAGCFGCAVAGGVLGGVIVGSAIANAANPPPPPP